MECVFDVNCYKGNSFTSSLKSKIGLYTLHICCGAHETVNMFVELFRNISLLLYAESISA